MRSRTIWLVALALALSPCAADACDEIKGKTAESPLHTRKPVPGEDVRLTSGFGMRFHPLLNTRKMHTGIDWAAPIGTPVLAAAGGRVISARTEGELGNAVRIDHGAGWQTLYANLSTFSVHDGDCVAPLADIGKVGATGLTAGPALHFEVQANGQPIDPQSLRSNDAASPVEVK